MDMSDLLKKLEEVAENQSEPSIPVSLPPPPIRSRVVLNELALPLRPGKEICSDFENYGLCRKGSVCPFDHPMDKRSKNFPDFSKSTSWTKELTFDEDEEEQEKDEGYTWY